MLTGNKSFYSILKGIINIYSHCEIINIQVYVLVFTVKVGSFLRWIYESSSQLKERGFEQSSKVWSGVEIVAAMEKQGITPATFMIYCVCNL